MASIKDIAKACGVSVATVSKALNGHNDISQATKEKVREAARQIGYMPNSAARALKTNRTYNLGVLFVDEAQSGLTHEFFAAVLDSFKRHAEGRGYDITFINHNIGHGHSSYLEHCRYRGVDGVIAACIKFDDPEVIELAYSNLPIVTVDHVFNNRAAVLSDNTDGVHKLVDQLAALGHERIAYIHGENHSAVTRSVWSVSTAPAPLMGSRCRIPTSCRAPTAMRKAAPLQPVSCWHCRSAPRQSSSRMTSPPSAASRPSVRKDF